MISLNTLIHSTNVALLSPREISPSLHQWKPTKRGTRCILVQFVNRIAMKALGWRYYIVFCAFWQYSSASSGSPFARRKVELWKKLQRLLMGRSMAHRKKVWWLRSSMKIRLETAMWKRLMHRRLATRNSACRIVFAMSSSVRPESWTSEA